MKKTKPDDYSMKVLATGTCDTLSGSSRLTYDIGKAPEGGIHLRISKNSGGGFFSDEWVAFEAILQALKKRPEGKPITSILLSPIPGKSGQHPGVPAGGAGAREIAAAPAGEAAPARAGGLPRCSWPRVEKLLASGTEMKVKAAKPTGKPPRRLPSNKPPLQPLARSQDCLRELVSPGAQKRAHHS